MIATSYIFRQFGNQNILSSYHYQSHSTHSVGPLLCAQRHQSSHKYTYLPGIFLEKRPALTLTHGTTQQRSPHPGWFIFNVQSGKALWHHWVMHSLIDRFIPGSPVLAGTKDRNEIAGRYAFSKNMAILMELIYMAYT